MAYIVVATRNAHKVDEYRKLLEGQKVELKSLLDYPAFPGVEETGKTFRENAGIKALAACKYCDVPAFADDSGLEVEALDGLPAHKLHCSVLAEEAIKNALKDYYDRNGLPYDAKDFPDCEHCDHCQ